MLLFHGTLVKTIHKGEGSGVGKGHMGGSSHFSVYCSAGSKFLIEKSPDIPWFPSSLCYQKK